MGSSIWHSSRPRAAVLALSLGVFVSTYAPALRAQIVPGFTTSQLPSIRVGSARTAATARSVDVPVFAENCTVADTATLALSFDAAVLEYEGYVLRSADWVVERAIRYGSERAFIFLRRESGGADEDAGGRPGGRLVELVDLRFLLRPPPSGEGSGGAASGGGAETSVPFFVEAKIGLGAEVDSDTGRGDSYFSAEVGQGGFAILPTRLYPGSVTVYYRDGIEAGSARATDVPQDFSIPLYATILQPGVRTFLVGVDYDELFFSARGVEGAGPTLADVPQDSLALLLPGRMCFRVELKPDFAGSVCRLHVANVVLRYNGAGDPGGVLYVVPRLLRGSEAGEGEAGAMQRAEWKSAYGESVAGAIELLPPHFIRGNVDSSRRTRSDGKTVYVPDASDALAILRAIFGGADEVECEEAADVTDNGAVDVSDAIWLLNHLYRGGPPPAPPYPLPGPDPTPDGLGCESSVAVYEVR
ncbi:MAG: hypothetical protein ACUVYA_02985 [Planctomycetota bacterium]